MGTLIHTATGSRVVGSQLPLNIALSVIPSLPRPLLARLVERAIDRMDALDGDADLELTATEDDFADHGRVRLGDLSAFDDEEDHRHLLDKPIYAIDQTKGPTNEAEAHAAYMRRQLGESR